MDADGSVLDADGSVLDADGSVPDADARHTLRLASVAAASGKLRLPGEPVGHRRMGSAARLD